MNLKSEIDYFQEMRLLDKARLLNLFLHELSEEARATYGPTVEEVHDTAHLRFVNELTHRLTRVIEQLLAEDATRPADDVVLRMLLSPRACITDAFTRRGMFGGALGLPGSFISPRYPSFRLCSPRAPLALCLVPEA